MVDVLGKMVRQVPLAVLGALLVRAHFLNLLGETRNSDRYGRSDR